MKKILFVSDTTLKDISPISDILRVLLRTPSFREAEKCVVEPRTDIFNDLIVEEIEGYRHFLTQGSYENYLQNEKSLMKKARYVFYKGLSRLGIKSSTTYFVDYLARVKEEFDFDFVVFLVNSPKIQVTRWLNKKRIKYVFFLHSTWIDNPCYDRKEIYSVESEIICGSMGYFVPSFFYDTYEEEYNSDKVIPYDLPLLIDKNTVITTINSITEGDNHYNLAYYGALQSFRNGKQSFDYFDLLGLKLDVFLLR